MTVAIPEAEEIEDILDFSSFELDARLTQVLAKQNITKPTLIQEKAIPLGLAGKDLLAKAKTGSGKTLSYVLPILQRLIATVSLHRSGICALILVPTKELSTQVLHTFQAFMHYFPKEMSAVNLASEDSLQLQRTLLSHYPTVVISTPSRLLPHLDSSVVNLQDLKFLVIDEADLVLSFGYSGDLERLANNFIPKTVQTFLMSATFPTEMEQLKLLVLRNPVTLRLEEETDEDQSRLQQFTVQCPADDKYLLLFVVLKLRLLQGKILIFTNDVERCYRLRLFLEQFGIKACILNPELPLGSRQHIVDEFNRGVYDIVIASDQCQSSQATGKTKRIKSDREFGVARGVDFKQVDVVINFDLPLQVDSYVHRVGRTARGTTSGTAISFVSSTEDEQRLKAIQSYQNARGLPINSHSFDLQQIEGFRYRSQDALRAVTKVAIREARLKAVKEELLRSEKLKSFFEERPKDLALLRHDQNTNVLRPRPHLKHVPDYLMPERHEQTKMASSFPKPDKSSNARHYFGGSRKRSHRDGKDPLRSFKLKKTKK